MFHLTKTGGVKLKWIIIIPGILIVSVLILFIFLNSLSFTSAPKFVRDFVSKISKQKSYNLSDNKEGFYYNATTPLKNDALSMEKRIIAKDGGEIIITDGEGFKISLFIPEGALGKDTKIKLTPLKEVPIENYKSDLGGGVLIEPLDINFKTPAFLTFSFKNYIQNPYSLSALYNNKKQKNIFSFNIIDTAYAAEEKRVATSTRVVSENSGVIYSNHKNNSISLTDSSTSKDGDAISTPMDKGGSYTPDNLDGDEADKVAKDVYERAKLNADALGPARICGDDVRRAVLRSLIINQSVRDPNLTSTIDDIQGLTDVWEECNQQEVLDFERRCKNNKMSLRRKELLETMQLIMSSNSSALNKENYERLKKVYNECIGEYQIKADLTQYPQEGAYITDSVDLKVCGFLDDVWVGEQNGRIGSPGYVYSDFEGILRFEMPANGGEFTPMSFGVLHGAVVPQLPQFKGPEVEYSGQAFSRNFDGKDTVYLKLLGKPDPLVGKITPTGNNNCDLDNKVKQFGEFF